MRTLLATALLFTALAATARLGETNIQIYNRYGPVQKRYEDDSSYWHATYLYRDNLVIVYYHLNTSVAEVVRPVDGHDFSGGELEGLRENISGQTNWVEDPGYGFGKTVWTNSTGFVSGTVKDSDTPNFMFVSTRDFVSRLGGQFQTEEKKKADGF